MKEWEISNQDIESTEKLLLPEGAHFSEDARNVIRCWHSTDVSLSGEWKDNSSSCKIEVVG